MGAQPQSLVQLRHITKRFGGVVAVDDVSLDVRQGEILCLVGENGAGKSTLMRVMAGVLGDDYEGELLVGGQQKRYRSVAEAERDGLVLISQELLVAPELSITENILMNRLPNRLGLVDVGLARERARHWLGLVNLPYPPETLAGRLSASEQRLMTIAGALAKDARLLILDEPTASLSDPEVRTLFAHLRALKARGLALLYISHRLDEIEEIADRVAVMRNGKLVAVGPRSQVDRRAIVRHMIGREALELPAREAAALGPEVLRVAGLTAYLPGEDQRRRLSNVTFSIRRGEIVGLFGLMGAGRTELAQTLFGAWTGRVEGDVVVGSSRGIPQSPTEAVTRGLAYLSENRTAEGVIPGKSVNVNMSTASLARVSWGPLIESNRERERNGRLVERLDVRPRDVDRHVDKLSGGNQQKVMLGRWLAAEPMVLVLDEPTHGVDVGAKHEIYQLIRRLSEEGAGILLISSELPEILGLSDRLLVLHEGELVGEFAAGGARREDIMHLAAGGRSDGATDG
jgi:ABC-type sugar transport system ATPase subunit